MNAQKIRDAITHDIHCLGCGEGFDCGRQIALRELDALEAQLRAQDEALGLARRHLKRARELELSAFGTDSETLAEVNTALAAIEEAGK